MRRSRLLRTHTIIFHSTLDRKKTTNKHACDTMLPHLRYYRYMFILSPASPQWTIQVATYTQNNLFHSTIDRKKITNTHACGTMPLILRHSSLQRCGHTQSCLLTVGRSRLLHTQRIIIFTLHLVERRSQTNMLVTLSLQASYWVLSPHNGTIQVA
jgi:hypothetical protein